MYVCTRSRDWSQTGIVNLTWHGHINCSDDETSFQFHHLYIWHLLSVGRCFLFDFSKIYRATGSKNINSFPIPLSISHLTRRFPSWNIGFFAGFHYTTSMHWKACILNYTPLKSHEKFNALFSKVKIRKLWKAFRLVCMDVKIKTIDRSARTSLTQIHWLLLPCL